MRPRPLQHSREPSRRYRHLTVLTVAALVGALLTTAAPRATSAPRTAPVRWYRLAFDAVGSYTAITKSNGVVVSTASGHSEFRGSSQRSAALQIESPGTFTLAT